MILPPAFKYLFIDSIALGVKFAASATKRTSVSLKSILLNLFKNFDFYIPDCQLKRYKDEDLSFNDFTMGPRNIKNKTLTDKSLAMYINVQPRNEPKSKL